MENMASVTEGTVKVESNKFGCQEIHNNGFDFITSKQLHDCKFRVGPEQQDVIPSYKFMLSMASPIFEKMFFSDLREKNDEILVPDILPEDFEIMLNYIYSGDINIASIEHANKLIYCSKKYQLFNLEEMCYKYLNYELSPSNCCQIFELAKFYDNQDLIMRATDIMKTCTKTVLSSENICQWKIDTLYYMFSLNTLTINSELDLFRALISYTTANDNQNKTDSCLDAICNGNVKEEGNGDAHEVVTIRDVIKKIRLFSVNLTDLIKVLAGTTLLTHYEIVSIILRTSSPESSHLCPMPDGFDTNRYQRKSLEYFKTKFTIDDSRIFLTNSFTSPKHYYKEYSWYIKITLNEKLFLDVLFICEPLNSNNFKWSIWRYFNIKFVNLHEERGDTLNLKYTKNTYEFSDFIKLSSVLKCKAIDIEIYHKES